MKVCIIPADETAEVRFEDVERINLEFLQGVVGGWIELLPIPGLEVNMYLNEEGKIEGLPLNHRASSIAHRTHAVSGYDYIVGDVVLVDGIDDEGDDTGLEEAKVEMLKWVLG